MSGREQILNTIRAKLGRGEISAEKRAELMQRMAHPPRTLIPGRARIAPAAQQQLFIKMAEQASASVVRVSDHSAVPKAVADFIAKNNLPSELVMASHPVLENLPWNTTPDISIDKRPAESRDKLSVTRPFAAVAETGTLAFASGPDSPITLNFLPDLHIAVLDADQIVGPEEDLWRRLREQNRIMPRALNLITGPSRSGDIEQTIYLGAHGPIQLHIILVGTSE